MLSWKTLGPRWKREDSLSKVLRSVIYLLRLISLNPWMTSMLPKEERSQPGTMDKPQRSRLCWWLKQMPRKKSSEVKVSLRWDRISQKDGSIVSHKCPKRRTHLQAKFLSSLSGSSSKKRWKVWPKMQEPRSYSSTSQQTAISPKKTSCLPWKPTSTFLHQCANRQKMIKSELHTQYAHF